MRRSYPMMKKRPSAALVGLALLAAGLAGCSGDSGPDEAVDAFLTGWQRGDLAQIAFVEPTGAKIAATDVAKSLKDLSGELPSPAVHRDGSVEEVEKTATAKINLDWTLPGGTHWTYPSTVRLTQGKDDVWSVIWEPALVNAKLKSGDQLGLRRQRPDRAGVLDGAGKPIVEPRDVVVVGVEPAGVDDPAGITAALDKAFKSVRPALPPIDLKDLPKKITSAENPEQFLEVVTLRKDAYDQIRSKIQPLEGTRFRAEKRDLAPTRAFARALLGSADPALKEDIDKNPDAVAEGDLVGHGGIQGAFDKQLRGTPGVSVVISQKAPDGEVNDGEELFRAEPKPGTPVKTTLDVRTQNAADTALAGVKQRSALVAVRVSDGAVLAAANGPDGGSGENLAFTAQVPPGSTFKMVSALGLLDGGKVTSSTVVNCPQNFTVDGRSFKNSESFALGKVPFQVDFAKSCNTAFASLAPSLGPDGLAAAGRSLGLEGTWDLGVDAFSGKVSTGGSDAERAAAAFGQGTTLVSPLAMASATAAVAKGSVVPPSVIADKPAKPGAALKAESLDPLRSMMRQVVTSGTATALKDVPGGAVSGKTGTAEFDDNPAHTHAWFVGWQGDVAFAVFVENGGGSGETAVPAAERFLRALH
ncbi:cell division protein FtsI/penicillin-binding protein 2 [Asanoa ferruginea]|uniref:Cell division protein FtsI/penicillin-binding protein 2 n=1 Tax=Asanoa ferruginea TaxID=53367 RepID=A0A3D9ZJQ1_9ACTN|nr:penicillin-binding transpeptidase domain-containing protein [Asanoa ferruginea]REF97656.1 cell division protein FtsI/penicillin-binding protein 2 [Asanoa ferruginea]GIF48756.1 penicillin-binding protein [Asanoa ferruginea]